MWLWHQITLSFRDVEDLLAERGVTVPHVAIRFWCRNLGPTLAPNLRHRHGQLGEVWQLDEVYIPIRGQRR